MVVRTVRGLRLRVEDDRVRVTLPTTLLEIVSHRLQARDGRIRKRSALEGRHIGQPLVMEPWCIYGLTGVHTKAGRVQHDLHNCIDDRASTGRARDHEELPIL